MVVGGCAFACIEKDLSIPIAVQFLHDPDGMC